MASLPPQEDAPSTGKPYCELCSQHIDGTVKYHKRLVHQKSTTLTFSNKSKLTVHREGGVFQCPTCHSFTSPDPNAISKHAAACTGPIGNASSSPETASASAAAIPPSTPATAVSSAPPTSLELVPVVASGSPPNPVWSQYRDAESVRVPSPAPLVECPVAAPLPLLVPIRNDAYCRVPDPFTVVDSPCDLLRFGIVVNTLLRSVICLLCGQPVLPRAITKHIRSHYSFLVVPPTLQPELIEKFGLTEEIVYPSETCVPIFGIPLLENPHVFCGQCNRGFATPASLENHQRAHCPKSKSEGPKSLVGYGQRIPGVHHRIIRVNIDGLAKATPDSDEGALDSLFESISITPDYSELPIEVCDDNLNLKAFFARDGWLDHIKGMTPADLDEAHRTHEPDDVYGDCLRPLADRFIEQTQVYITDTIATGLNDMLGSVRLENNNKEHHFRRLRSFDKYGLVLHRLVFACLRFYVHGTWTSNYKYPDIDPTQLEALRALDLSVRECMENDYTEATDRAFRTACVALFKHLRHEYAASRKMGPFFSPVICFLVAHCIEKDSSTASSNSLTRVAAALEYSIRASFLHLAVAKADVDGTDKSDALLFFRDYLSDQKASVMSFLCHSHSFLKTIRGDEYNRESFAFADLMQTRLTHRRGVITLKGIKELVEGQYDSYMDTLRRRAFFGEIPDDMFPDIEIEGLFDDIHRNTVGYSFLVEPKNDLTRYRSRYAKWLLSDEDRRRKFISNIDGRVLWRPEASVQLLKAFSLCQLEMAPGLIVSCGPSVRGSEFGRLILFDLPGAPRNVGIVLQALSINATNDKTSHQRNRDLFLPHVPTREWAMALLHFLVIIRPFQTYLAEQLFPDQGDIVLRYRHYLWPGIQRNMSSNDVREQMKQATQVYLKNKYTLRAWRTIFTCFSTTFRDSSLVQVSGDHYSDLANMHSSTTAVARYGGGILDIFRKDSRDIAGCVRVGIEWHKLVGIGQANPICSGAAEPLPNPSSSSALMPFNSDAMARQVAVRLEHHMDVVVRETIRDRMAEMAAAYFPPPPIPLDSARLRPVSDVVVHPSRLADLRAFLRNPNAQFTCPEQAVLLEHLAAKKENILAVLGTSFGKTTLIMMMAKMYGRGKTTVVILPLSTLHADLEGRAREHGLTYSRWSSSGKFSAHADILSVAVEVLDDSAFFGFLVQLENMNRLDRVVFDEVHKALTDGGYRPVFSYLSRFNKLKSPLVGLSGSLPQRLFEAFSSVTRKAWKVIRMPSNRKELRYEVRSVHGDLVAEVVAYIQSRMDCYEPHERGLVFCRSKDQADSIGRLLGVQAYHASSTDTNEQVKEDFLQGKQKVLPTTAFLGCGYNYLHIRDVVHASISHSMLDQYQEDSRGGRDGAMCHAITFVDPRNVPRRSDSEYDLGFDDLCRWSQTTDQCLRIIPSLYLDGVAVTCILLAGAVFCDYCERACSEPPPASAPLLPQSNPARTPLTVTRWTPPTASLKRPLGDPSPERSEKIPRTDSPEAPMDVDVPDDGVIANGDASAVSISGPVSNGAADGDAACISGAANGAAPSSPVPVASTEDRRLVKAPLPSTSLAGFTVALGRMGREKSERDFQEQICRPVEKLQEFWESHCVRCYLKDATGRDRRTDYGHRTDLCGAGGIAPLRHLNFPKSMICYTCCCPMGTQRSTHPTTVGRGCPRSDVFKRLANAYWVGNFEARLSLIKDGSVSTDAKFAQWLSSVDPSMKDADPHLSVLRIWPFIRDFCIALNIDTF